MEYPTLRFVFDRKKVATKDKKGLVQIEVCSERRRKWIGTGVKVFSDQWDDKKKVVRSLQSVQPFWPSRIVPFGYNMIDPFGPNSIYHLAHLLL